MSKGQITFAPNITSAMLDSDKNTVVFGENAVDKAKPVGAQRSGNGSQASVLGGVNHKNAYGIVTCSAPGKSLFGDNPTEKDIKSVQAAVSAEFGGLKAHLDAGRNVIIPVDKNGNISIGMGVAGFDKIPGMQEFMNIQGAEIAKHAGKVTGKGPITQELVDQARAHGEPLRANGVLPVSEQNTPSAAKKEPELSDEQKLQLGSEATGKFKSGAGVERNASLFKSGATGLKKALDLTSKENLSADSKWADIQKFLNFFTLLPRLFLSGVEKGADAVEKYAKGKQKTAAAEGSKVGLDGMSNVLEKQEADKAKAAAEKKANASSTSLKPTEISAEAKEAAAKAKAAKAADKEEHRHTTNVFGQGPSGH
jgi:hypothetical protein